MPTIETIARPVRNRISVEIPKRYRAYSFRVVLVPIEPEENREMDAVDAEIDPRVRSMRGLIKVSPGDRIGDERHDEMMARYEALP
jgi:hypothetical protein